jgi:hypothetical protein
MALREMAMFPRLVNSTYSAKAGQHGSTIDVPLPGAVTGIDIATGSSNLAPDPTAVAPTTVPIVMNKWWDFPFTLDDREMLEAMEGTIPMQASEAVRGLANKVDASCIDLYVKVTQFQGTFGAVGFDYSASSATATPTVNATGIRKQLSKALAPNENRHVVLTPDTEAQALQMRAFQDASWSGSVDAILAGNLNQKLGFRWWIDQNLNSSFTTGTLSSGATIEVQTTTAAGATSVPLAAGAGEVIAFNKGDLIVFSNHSTVYCVQADLDVTGAANGNVSIFPALTTGVTATTHTVTFASGYKTGAIDAVESGSLNLGFHRDAFAFANRPLGGTEPGLGSISQTAIDPVSGLALRLEVTREYKRTRFSYDMLWGVDLVRPNFVVRFHAKN